MSVSKTDLNFLYTSVEPAVTQMNPSQSIGGYPSDSAYSQVGDLSTGLSLSSTSIGVNTTTMSSNLLVDSEIIQTQGIGESLTVLNRGALNSTVQPHAVGSPVYSIPTQSLFNNALSKDFSQYRCLAVKNTNQTNTFYGLCFYFKSSSLTLNTNLQMAVEIPKTEYYSGVALKGTVISIVDSSLYFADNWFIGCVVKINSGFNINQRRTIISFDSNTQTLVFDSSFPFAVATGDAYEIQNAPSQLISSGNISPIFNSTFVSATISAAQLGTAIGIDVNNGRANGQNLAPNEVVYLWFIRTRAINSASQNNRIIFTAHYRTVE